MLQTPDLAVHGGVFFPDGFVLRLRDQTDPVSDLGQPPVCVVLSVEQAVFAARGHDAVGLLGPLRHQIVDQRSDVAVRAPQDHRRLALELQGCVHARHEALHRRFLIARGPVELARAVEPGDFFALQRGQKLGGVHAVIFDGIGRAHHLGVLQPGDGVEHGKLDVLGQGGGEALQIQLLGVQTAGLHK